MKTPLLREVLGLCDFSRREITITERARLKIPKKELSRLTDLGERCIRIAQIYGGQVVKEEMRMLGLTNFGTEEYPIYPTDAYWFFGIIGGLEIHCSQKCDGPRCALVKDKGKEVFDYDCSGIFGSEIENSTIVKYVKGPWEEKVLEWYHEAIKIFNERSLVFQNLLKE